MMLLCCRLLCTFLSATSVATAFTLVPSHRPVSLLTSKLANDDNEECIHDGTPTPRWVCPDHADVCNVTGVTLGRYMMEMARYNPELDEIESIFTSIQTASKTISSLVRRAFLTGHTGAEAGGGSINVQGEEQKKLDVICNNVLKSALKWTGKLGTVASEEEDAPVIVDNRGNKVYSNDVLLEQEGTYVAVFDPLDGSSNVDAGIPVGTIFGIFANADECSIDEDPDQILSEQEQRCLFNTLQPGTNLVGESLYNTHSIIMTHTLLTLITMQLPVTVCIPVQRH